VLNDHVHQLVRCLVGFDRHVHQLRHQSSNQRLEPGVCAELKKHCLVSVAATRKLMQTLRLHGPVLLRGVDVRLVRQSLLAFHGVSYEVRLAAERLPCAAAMPPLARNPQNATAAPASFLGNVPLGLARGLARASMRRTATAPSDSNSRAHDVFSAGSAGAYASSSTGTPSSIGASFSPKLPPASAIGTGEPARSATLGATTTTPMPITQPLVGQALIGRRPTAPDIRMHMPSGAAGHLPLPETPTTPAIHLPEAQRDVERHARLVRATETCIHATATATEQMRQVVMHYSRVDSSSSNDNGGKDDTAHAGETARKDDTSSTRSLPRSGHLSVEKLNELNRHLAHAVTRLSTAAKGVSLIFSLSRAATMSLQSMIQSTRDLTLIMATLSGRMSPRPLLRNNTMPSGRTSPLPPGSAGSMEPIPSINVNGP
ncbi:hypothetical protein SYNPS1DRAFT_25853, partial [Syncephalis pseudoplumigaleata]